MPSDATALPPAVTVSAGHYYPDGWISPRLTLELRPPAAGSTLLIAAWNPDFTPLLSNNSIQVEFEDETKQINSISPNQTIEILLRTPSTGPVSVSLNVSRYLDACEYDERQRALKIVRMDWLDGPEG